ncbi:hypothetical protein H0H87_012332 [Tephrocybe sp. NHM501043]|nr:hypothetical protein H0H87_012332 [Tephrocybe sp. NHM501043]
MLQAIRNLVDGAQAGDRFFFHYAGHAGQIENKNFSEEDGLDECIIPSDGESRMIRDNELRWCLVDPLPIGSNLIVRFSPHAPSSLKPRPVNFPTNQAIFDSCHSASLLDLEHLRCNQVYVPWVSKGKRKSDSRWNANDYLSAFSRNIYQHKRVSHDGVAARRASVHQLSNPTPNYRRLSINTGRSIFELEESETWYDSPSSPIKRLSGEKANVISISASKDEQISWEDADGGSMTKALVNILKANPHPPLVHLLRDISHELHDLYLKLHTSSRIYRKRVRELNKRRARRGLSPYEIPVVPRPEMDNFQDPQESTHEKDPVVLHHWKEHIDSLRQLFSGGSSEA